VITRSLRSGSLQQALLSGGLLYKYLMLTSCHKTIDHILGATWRDLCAEVADLSVPLDRLTASAVERQSAKLANSLAGSVGAAAAGAAASPEPASAVSEDTMNELLTFLFPDSASDDAERTERGPNLTEMDAPKDPVPSPSATPGSVVKLVSGKRSERRRRSASSSPLNTLLQVHLCSVGGQHLLVKISFLQSSLDQAKIAPDASLTFRLALLLCHLSNSLQSELVFAQLWREFLLELRYRFENGIKIPWCPIL